MLRGEPLPVCDLVILPGSKATISDLAALRAEGWDIDLRRTCGAAGACSASAAAIRCSDARIADPAGIEGPPSEVAGLGLLDVTTVMTADKSLVAVAGVSVADGAPFSGYEMHVGETAGPDCARPVLRFSDGRADGARSADGAVSGVYVHGLFADDAQRAALVCALGGTPARAQLRRRDRRHPGRFRRASGRPVDLDRILTLAT